MLTNHQKHHLDAIIKEAQENKLESMAMIKVLSKAKNVKDGFYNLYLNSVINKVRAIITSGIFPSELQRDSHIHDFLEKDNIQKSWQIQL